MYIGWFEDILCSCKKSRFAHSWLIFLLPREDITWLRNRSDPGEKNKILSDLFRQDVQLISASWLTWIELTTPLAMTESFPATERTPSLSCDMSGALGSTLLKRYELPVHTRRTQGQASSHILHQATCIKSREVFKKDVILHDAQCVLS